MRDTGMKNKDILIIMTVFVGASIIIAELVRYFYIDQMDVTLLNLSLILATGLITASLFFISCELPSAVEEQWLQKTDEIKGVR
jgi:hypothetical protein